MCIVQKIKKRFKLASERLMKEYNLSGKCKFYLDGVKCNGKKYFKEGVIHFTIYHYDRYVKFIFGNGRVMIYPLVKNISELEQACYKHMMGRKIDPKWIKVANSLHVRTLLGTTSQTMIHRFLYSIMTFDINDEVYDLDLNIKPTLIQSRTLFNNIDIEMIDYVPIIKQPKSIPPFKDRITNPILIKALKDGKIGVNGGCLINKSITNDIDIHMRCSFDEYKSIIERTIECDKNDATIETMVVTLGQYEFSLGRKPLDNGCIYNFPYFTSISADWNNVYTDDQIDHELESMTMTYDTKHSIKDSWYMFIRSMKYLAKGFKFTNPEFDLYANCKQFIDKLSKINQLPKQSFHLLVCDILRAHIRKPNDFKFEFVDYDISFDQEQSYPTKEIIEDVQIKTKHCYELDYIFEWAITKL